MYNYLYEGLRFELCITCLRAWGFPLKNDKHITPPLLSCSNARTTLCGHGASPRLSSALAKRERASSHLDMASGGTWLYQLCYINWYMLSELFLCDIYLFVYVRTGINPNDCFTTERPRATSLPSPFMRWKKERLWTAVASSTSRRGDSSQHVCDNICVSVCW